MSDKSSGPPIARPLARMLVSVAMLVVGTVLALVQIAGSEGSMLLWPAIAIALLGALGIFGVNIFWGGPLDKGDDLQPMPAKPPMPPSDEVARLRLLERVGDLNDFSRPRPLVTLEEFFEGNNDPGSIGYNLSALPMPRDFYELLKEIRQRPDVADVLIEVKDLEDPEGWPATDTIWIITTTDADTVKSWFPKHLEPDEMIEGFEGQPPIEPYDVPAGYIAVGAWYD